MISSCLHHKVVPVRKVYIVAHIPPGVLELPGTPMWFRENFNSKFNSILRKYADVITAVFSGHQHFDSFRIIYDNNGEIFHISVHLCEVILKLIPAARFSCFRLQGHQLFPFSFHPLSRHGRQGLLEVFTEHLTIQAFACTDSVGQTF